MLGSKGPPIGIGYKESNSHVIDNVSWPWKVRLVTPIEPSISKTA